MQDAQQHILVDKYSISNDNSSLSMCTSTCTGKLYATAGASCVVFFYFSLLYSGKHVLRKHPLVLTIHLARFEVITSVLLKLPNSGMCCCVVGMVHAVPDVQTNIMPFICRSNFDYLILKVKMLTFGLLNGYEIYPGLVFSSRVVSGIELQAYKFFYLFFEVLLTQYYH